MDGCNAFPDAEAGMGKCRDELERARLQVETGHENHWCQLFDEGALDLKSFVLDDLDSCITLSTGSDETLIIWSLKLNHSANGRRLFAPIML